MSTELQRARAHEDDSYVLLRDAEAVRDQIRREMSELIGRLQAQWMAARDETLRLMKEEGRA